MYFEIIAQDSYVFQVWATNGHKDLWRPEKALRRRKFNLSYASIVCIVCIFDIDAVEKSHSCKIPGNQINESLI